MKQYECIKDFLNYKVGTIFIDDKEHSRSRWFNRRHFSNKEYFKEVQQGRWKPKHGDPYYVYWIKKAIKYTYTGSEVEEELIKLWEAFQTEEQAEAYKYLVEHEQRMADNWDKKWGYFEYKVFSWWGSIWWNLYPSKWVVPMNRTEKQKLEHKKKLLLVYHYLFNK